MKLPYGRQLIDEEDVQAVVGVLRGDWLTQGPAVDRFEEALAASTGARHAVVVANGTVALHLACLAAGLGPGDEGITSPITFAASANAVVYCGGTPRFADIDAATWNIDPQALAERINSRTKVVIPVHFAGLPCDLRAIRETADRTGAVVVADACHALGAELGGSAIGGTGFAQMTCLSFHPVKHITTGEGGAVLTDDPLLAKTLRRLRHHGIVNDPAEIAADQGGWYHEIQAIGYNARLTDLQCALGTSQLAKLPRFLERRRAIAARYLRAFADVPGLRTQALPAGRAHAYHLFVVHLDPAKHDRRRVYDRLRTNGIYSQVHYIPVHLHPFYRRTFGYRPGDFPHAERYYAGALSLPIFPAMGDADVDTVIGALRQALGSSA